MTHTVLEVRFLEAAAHSLPKIASELEGLNKNLKAIHQLLEKLLGAEQDRPFKGP